MTHEARGRPHSLRRNTPAEGVQPVVVAAMREVDIDLSQETPKAIARQEILDSDIVVTMGCASGDVCPATFRGDAVAWTLKDPAGKSMEEVRRIRNEIEAKVTTLMEEVARGMECLGPVLASKPYE